MLTVARPIMRFPRMPGQRLILHVVPWTTYERLLSNYADNLAPRFAYDRGTLETVTTLSSDRVETNRALDLLIDLITGELEIEARSVGGMTFRRTAVQRGFESDSSDNIQTASAVEGTRASLALPFLPSDILNTFLAEYSISPRHRWQRSIRDWARQQATQDKTRPSS